MADQLPAEAFVDELRRLRAEECWLELAQKGQNWLNSNDPHAAVSAEMAFAAARLRLFEQAERVALSVLQHMDNANVLAVRTLVLCRLHEQNFTEALRLARRVFLPPFAFSNADENAQAMLTLASVHHALGEADKALAIARLSLELAPSAAAHALTAFLLFKADMPGEALEAATASLDLFPRRAEVWRLRAAIFHRLNRLEDMFAAYETALQHEPDDVETLASLGEWYARIHRHEKARELFMRALRIQPGNAQAWTNLGKLHITLNQYGEGIEAFKAAYAIDPTQPEVLANMAVLHSKFGNKDLAIELMKQSHALAPDNRHTTIALALHYAREDNWEESDAVMAPLLAREAQSPMVLSAQAQLAHLREEYDQEIDFYSKAIESELWFLKQQSSLDLFGDATPPYMDVYDASTVLLDACEFLEQIGVPYFLIGGTLLGILRDGELLPHDKDIDLGIPWDVDREWLMDQIEASEKFVMNGLIRPASEVAEWNFSFVRKGTPIAVDLFFFKREDEYWLEGFYMQPFPCLLRYKQRTFTTLHYRDRDLSIPCHPEEMMEEIFGVGWRIPDKYFDTILSAHNLYEKSFCTSEIIGYGRLLEHMRNRSWEKVYACCNALKRFHSNPVLDAVSEWLVEFSPETVKGFGDRK